MKKLILPSIIVTAIICLSSFTIQKPTPEKPIELANFDKSVKPSDNFYQFVNGGWVKNNPVPPTETRWGSFSIVEENTKARLKVILEELEKNSTSPTGSSEQKIRDFYKSAMDTISIEKMGTSPLMTLMKKVDEINDPRNLYATIGELNALGIRPFFGLYVGQDDKDATKMIVNLSQGGLGLPDRDYYLKDDDDSKKILNAYFEFISKMFSLTGVEKDKANEIAKHVIEIETRLAKASRTRVQLRDPEANYNKMGLEELRNLAPTILWDAYSEKTQLNFMEVVVGQPEFVKELNFVLEQENMDDLKNYMKWNIINSRAGALTKDFVTTNFDFYEGVLRGAKEMKPRWKRVLDGINGSMGELLGQLYVKKYFSADSKKRVQQMVTNLIAAYRERISSRTWMADETKKAALAKLEKIMPKLAYPDKWRDYADLKIASGASFFENVNEAARFSFNYNKSKLDKPVDKTEWGMSPQTVNAYYNPGFNEIVFPAAIMQPPFFYPDGDDAVNYGGMGAVIGHEITHGFDDQGNQYDADGNLKNWWTDEDKKRFRTQADRLVDEYNHFVTIDTLTVNGSLTQGENIADLGGMTIAYAALQKALEGKTKQPIDGFTPEQRFFISFAQVWRNNVRDAELKRRLKVDPHSPGKFRTNGPLSNMPEFYKAFDVKTGDSMYRDDRKRVEIW